MTRRPATHEAPSPRLHPLVLLALACLALAALSLLLPSTPTYDPWAWINWGREIAGLDLNTREGPSWKPLPVLFTTLFAPAGDAAPLLWLVVARAGALMSLVMAWRLTSRLAGRPLGAAAGTVAVVALLLTEDWLHNAALGNSEPLLAALALLAVERHLDGRTDHALMLGFAAGLLRPEVWPFLGLYGAWLWRAEPSRRRLAGALLALLPALWFLPELWGSGDLLRASDRANAPNPDSPAFADRPALVLLESARDIVVVPVLVGAAAALAAALGRFARARADGVVVALGLVTLGWVGVVAAMTELGYAGNLRYLSLPAALACVLCGVGFARVVTAAREAVPGTRSRRLAAAAGVAALLVAAALPAVAGRGELLADEASSLHDQALLQRDLGRAVERAGGRERLAACGRPVTGPYQVPAVAWELGVHSVQVGLDPEPPAVLLRPRPKGPGRLEPHAGRRFRRIARAGRWEVLTACGKTQTASREAP